MPLRQVVMEVGPRSPWMSRMFARLGHEVIVAGMVGVVRSRVAGGGQAHHGRGDIGRDGVVRTAPAVAVGERGGSARAVGGEESPRVARADTQDLGGLHELQVSAITRSST